ncbi:winged helix-turn-helix transcriptional regulator [bacterium]|nr:winged helix-turn-helix transcriptional regulator [bacterium]
MSQPDQLFKAFSDATRLRLLNLLAQRPHCVCEFQRILRVPQPRISRHLAYLRRAGLVVQERHGKMVMYALAEPASAVHAAMLRCVRGCFQEIDFLKRDAKRARNLKPVVCP